MSTTDPQNDDQTTTAPEADDIDLERIERFSAYVDAEMTDAEREAFEAELDADPTLAAEFETFVDTLSVVQDLGPSLAPEAFVQQVEGRIRTRSRGRFFSDDFFYRSRVPYEVFAIVMLGIVVVMLWFGETFRVDRGDIDLAMAGSSDDKEDPGPDEAPAPTRDKDAVAPIEDPRVPEVAPVRREIMVYSISIEADAPDKAADALAARIKTTRPGAALIRNARGESRSIAIQLKDAEVEAFLEAFASEGRLIKTRSYVEARGDARPPHTVTFMIDKKR